MSIEMVELYSIFEESLGKKKAQVIVRDISALANETQKKLATKENLQNTELRLIKEIEQVRLDVSKEIEQVRLAGEEGRLRLGKEIEQVRLNLKEVELKLTKEIEKVRSSVTKWVAGLLIAQTGVIVTMLMLLK